MTDAPPPAATWPRAAEDLARRVPRRARLPARLRPIARGLLAAATLVGIAKAAATGTGSAVLLAAAGLVLLGALVGVRAARKVPETSLADAAWALDRLAGARERGLTAALVHGPAAAEAAWSSTGAP